MKKLLLTGCVFIVTILVMSSLARAERPVKILLLDPLSGPMTDVGERFLAGIRFAAEEANAQGGLLGRQVEVVAEDSRGNLT